MANPESESSKKKKPPRTHVDSLLNTILGQPFEFLCPEINVMGTSDHEEPLFRGPGTISAGRDGDISFRLFDQIQGSGGRNARILKTINSREPLRFFGTDSFLTEWAGGWFVPEIHFTQTNTAVVSGWVQRISTRVPMLFGPEREESTGLSYAEKLPLTMQGTTEIRVIRGNRTISRNPRADHTIISDREFLIHITEDLASGFTRVIAKNRPDLMPPYTEIALADALTYVLCRNCRPRVVVRFSKADAQVFVQTCNLDARTGLPDPLRGSPSQATFHWEIFKGFIRQYVNRSDFSSVPIARRLNEGISASNGTLHGFMASLLHGIENLFTALAVAPSSYTKDDVTKLHEHVKSWIGVPEVKSRALGLLTMLNTPSPTAILKDLQRTGVITANEAESWKVLRPKVSHGELVDVSDQDIWVHRGRLITMFHRLILRTIGYRGPITDFSGGSLKTVEFDWSDDC